MGGGGKRTAADLGAGVGVEDESGQSLSPPKGRTRGALRPHPVVRVTAAHRTHLSLAALTCVKPGRGPG